MVPTLLSQSAQWIPDGIVRADHTALIDGSDEIGFSPLLGAKRLSHALFLGHSSCSISPSGGEAFLGGPSGPEMANQFRRIRWQYVSEGEVIGPVSQTSQNKDRV